MMSSLDQQKQREELFQQSLAALEQSFAAPFNPAEAGLWITANDAALTQLQPQLERAQRIHGIEFAEIAREDLGLTPRIEHMRGEDGVIAEEGRQLMDRIAALRARTAGGDTAVWDGELSQVAEQGLGWVSRVRHQELAIRTWMVEAYTRDRGVVD